MTRPPRSPATPKTVETLRHQEDRRANIPTAEYQSVVPEEVQSPIRVAIARRNRDLDPQLVWRGKDEQDERDLEVWAPPLYIQEKVHPKVLIDDLLRESKKAAPAPDSFQQNFFADFNGVPEGVDKTDFYKHDANWTNRMILGDSLQVMASLAEREGLRGKVQCIYIDPPYGIKFNSNFQWSTTSRDVKDGNAGHITREPEQVKAFRDTWRDGIHSYLGYLRDRLEAARELLTDSGSVFVQIGDENVHRVRSLMDELFGDDNQISCITLKKTAGQDERLINNVSDYILWYCRSKASIKFRPVLGLREANLEDLGQYTRIETAVGRRRLERSDFDMTGRLITPGRPFRRVIATSSGHGGNTPFPVSYRGRTFTPTAHRHWSTHLGGMVRLAQAERLDAGEGNLEYVRFFDDFIAQAINNVWTDVGSTTEKRYVVETAPAVIQRLVLMTTDPGDLVLDPTCGSGTTATVAEQWGRRWITIDTSRVALALARARIMGARYPYYLLADSKEGQQKEAEVTRAAASTQPVTGNVRHGFVYERVPHITLKSIANNAEIDVIWEKWEQTLAPLRVELSKALGKAKTLEEWEVPRALTPSPSPDSAALAGEGSKLLARFWEARIARQKEIDASIAAKAEFEYLYDRPYEDKKKVRVAGPFTVESVSPHRMLAVDEQDNLFDTLHEEKDAYEPGRDFTTMILENLKLAGVQQAHKEDRISFTSLTPWPGYFLCAEGKYSEGETGREVRAGIFVGPEFGTVSRMDLVEAAKEAGDAGFDVVIACAFNYDAHSAEFEKLGRIPILKARMNADLHMADDLKNTGKGNLFVIFGEPDIEILPAGDDGEPNQIRVQVNGVDVFHPQSGEVRSDGPEGIACWFIDTDYNGESFFVRHAYFLGQNDPYKSLKTSLKAEINEDAWDSLHSAISRPFDKPTSGKIAVKIINHLGDEVMKVFGV
ncbi:MAG: site-specific DNA-methyltransferase [Dehalococcoidia bacterium]|nr:site-specific DNA-methyltransferase [Dehalococcoidia bacterium]